MDTPGKFIVRIASWRDDRAALAELRRQVFIVEQGVPESMEWDAADAACIHALAHDMTGLPIGTGRLLSDSHIGRMAVIPAWRRHGVGSAVLDFLIESARQRGHEAVHLNAQTHALDFYIRHGFIAHGDEFMDAGIPHRKMTLKLRKSL